ncbi:MAG TPA: 3-oxoacyl-ACP synthase [Rhodobacteraceae bacterium]|nr:3-oxoacyl-ACP synthase [Paracoccaceae bacterium]
MNAHLEVLETGMVTAVGLNAAASCAAMRGKIDGFCETRFIGSSGDWLTGAPVPLPRNWIGMKRLAHLAAGAIYDVFEKQPHARENCSLILCLAEEDRPGNLTPDSAKFARMIGEITEIPPKTKTRVITHGRPSGIVALDQARRILKRGEAANVLIVGVDSYLSGVSVAHYLANERLLTPDNANGFIPGEAAAAILVSATRPGGLALGGVGLAREKATIYNDEDLPLRADGMTEAYRLAMKEAGVTLAQVDYRIADLIGEQYFFKQSALAALRLERGRKEFQDLWSPAESLGNIGAAVVPMMIGMALVAQQKGYSGGTPVLIEASADDGACGAAVFHERAA